MVDGRQVDFERENLKPFCLRFIREIRQAQPKAIFFLENFPGLDCPEMGPPRSVAGGACHPMELHL